MSAHVCKVCKQSSGEISDFILCRGNCTQYLHYSCATIAEERFRNMSNKIKRKWKCKDCRVQRGLNSPKTESLGSENDSGNSLSSDIESVEDCFDSRNGDLPNNVNEMNALRQELTQTVKSLEQLRTKYNEITLKVSDIEQQMRAQETNLNKFSVDIRDINKNVCTQDQNLRNNRLEIHGLVLGAILTGNLQGFEDYVKRKIVEVGRCFGVQFSVNCVERVDILRTQNSQQPVLLVYFFSKEVRDRLIAARKTPVFNSGLPGGLDERRIYINENLSPFYKTLWYEARKVAKRKGFHFVWVREGKLFVKKNSESRKKLITCKEDLDKLEAD